MKFDTRDKKPNVWNIAILSAVVAVLTGILIRGDLQEHAVLLSVIYDVYFVVVFFMLIVAFRRQIQYNPYSYNTIYYMGFALFCVSLLITHIVLTVYIIRYPAVHDGMQIFYLLKSSAKNWMILTSPFILVYSIVLCVSNVSLIRHEGKRLVNLLGILLAAVLVGGEVFLYLFDFYASGSEMQVFVHDMVVSIFAAIYLYFECMLVGAIIANVIAARHEPDPDKDFLIILGCGIRKDGTPTPLLRGRIDRAIAFAKRQKEETGKDLIFITSGGQGPNEVVSESACMKRYMVEQGIPSERVFEEDRSTNTFENMKFSKEIIQKINPDGKVAFSTTNYHVFRSGLHARRLKMRAVGMGAKTKWYFFPNAWVREFVGILTDHRVKQAIIFASLIFSYALMTVLVHWW
ncbi:MAG: YdcF family protein [Lachnospiraceae bacterium]|nr:YdcF family protein [Lachnospiraceae bacterium]